ncbi:carboxymuconolactone decarboxylase family protein [Mangrovicoccus algicola]|uniref:Uncharacterized protein n=1 Tax=Mangrovicoccus algicola TaxID=2771008 RepID=A0A8J7CK96_9RHOB|nr:hypothetical protein [Mangrovicoccus algicola]MBE3638491.1 hypothetical protein [Mangrovicoccus algicola]
MFGRLTKAMIARREARLGLRFPHVHRIAETSPRLLMRYGRFLSFLDPNQDVPPEAYHLARIRGAMAGDCAASLEAEIARAKAGGLREGLLREFLTAAPGELPGPLADVMRLADAVVRDRRDDPEARDRVRAAFGEDGLIELSYAMNGAALIPGLRRSMGFCGTPDPGALARLAAQEAPQ